MAVGILIAFAIGTSFGYIMCAVLSANMTDEEWQKTCGAPIQPTVPPMPCKHDKETQDERNVFGQNCNANQ